MRLSDAKSPRSLTWNERRGTCIVKTKTEIRNEMRHRRRSIDADDRASASAAVCARILARSDVQEALAAKKPFAVYLATQDELDVMPLVEALWAEDVTVAVPCWDAAHGVYVLGAYTNATTLAEGSHHIPEPVEVNEIAAEDVGVWIVPGLAFTPQGARLGYGGGWFDRLLAKADAHALKLGVAYPFQMVDELPQEAYDRTLTAVVTADWD